MSMTEENNSTDEISAEENEAAKSIDLRAMGIDPMNTPIDQLLKHYRTEVDTVKAFTKAMKEGVSDPDSVDAIVKTRIGKLLKCEGTTEEQTAGIRSIRESIQTNVVAPLFTDSGATNSIVSAAVVLDELRSLVAAMEDEYSYHLNKSIQSEKDKRGIKSTPSETATTAKLTAVALSNLVKARLAMAEAMSEEIGITNLYKTDGVRKGFNADVFPRLPKLDSDGPVSANSTHLTFRWLVSGGNEETDIIECEETTLNDVAHNVVSSGSYRVTGKDVSAMLKKAGHGIGATESEWSLTFKTGVLKGRKA